MLTGGGGVATLYYKFYIELNKFYYTVTRKSCCVPCTENVIKTRIKTGTFTSFS